MSAGQAGVDAAMNCEALDLAVRSVAEPGQRIEAASDLPPDVRPAMYALLSSVADNKYLLGRRYAEWCTGAPMLEAAVAAAAMAQDELGHARSFYPLLRGFPEATPADTMEEAGWQTRPTSAMGCLGRQFASWSEFVAANLLVDTAMTLVFESASESAFEPLRQRARKIVQEETGHWVHARGWARRLAKDAHRRPELAASLERVWDHALTWLGADDDPVTAVLRAAGILLHDSRELRRRFLERVRPPLLEADLEVLLDRPLPWDRWDVGGRRLVG